MEKKHEELRKSNSHIRNYVVYDTELKCRCGKACADKAKVEKDCSTANMIQENDERYIVIEVDC